MDLVTHDYPNYDISVSLCGMNVKSTRVPTTAVSCSVVTSSSESLPNDGEKPNQPKRPLFPKWDYGHALSKSSIHKSILEELLYWETGGFCTHKSGSLYNQVVEVICQEVAMMLHALYMISKV